MPISVGIMSMQRIHNYGSSLQAYGLRRLVEGAGDDVRVSFVDYEPGEILVKEHGAHPPASKFRRAVSKVAEYNQVDAKLADKLRFFNHKRCYGKRYFPMLGIPPAPNRDLDLDVQIIGSDEVFNCVQSNTNVGFSRDLFGHRSPARRVISYAGSFGNTTMEEIEAFSLREMLADDFSRFAAISVRDRNSAQIVEELTGRQPEIHLDPVLVYDFMRLEERIPTERQFAGKYILVYGYSGRLDHEENEIVKRYARDIGAKVVCLGGVQECCDRFVDCDPFELIAFFRDAEAIITDTFHGTILAIINGRPFGSLIRRSVGHGYGNEEKLGYLLDALGLPAQKLTDIAQMAEVLSNDVDYHAVGEVLERERDRTLVYLRRTLR